MTSANIQIPPLSGIFSGVDYFELLPYCPLFDCLVAIFPGSKCEHIFHDSRFCCQMERFRTVCSTIYQWSNDFNPTNESCPECHAEVQRDGSITIKAISNPKRKRPDSGQVPRKRQCTNSTRSAFEAGEATEPDADEPHTAPMFHSLTDPESPLPDTFGHDGSESDATDSDAESDAT